MELQVLLYFITPCLISIKASQLRYRNKDAIPNIKVECNSNDIDILVDTKTEIFDGMIYPEGLSKNSSCMVEFQRKRSPISYKLPLRSCNTMSTIMNDGNVEYFNSIVIQPHRKLVTNQGQGFQIRCLYQTRGKIIYNDYNVRLMEPTSITATAPMPACNMKIFSDENKVAENVKIGDVLNLVITIDQQNIYGLKVTDCLVRDGLGWGEQRLIDSNGCPADPEIMGLFSYTKNLTEASVKFQAHKFPYTASVYYQCNVKLCFKSDGCEDVPPVCANENRRRKRNEESPATIEVYSGLYVNEVNDFVRPEQFDLISQKYVSGVEDICISQRHLAISISAIGLLLMVISVTAFLILFTRKKSRRYVSNGSSIYSGPYTNTAYS